MPLNLGNLPVKKPAHKKFLNEFGGGGHVHVPKFKLLKIGSDTEMFLKDKRSNKPVPVIGLLGGTKEEPLSVPELGEGFAVQEDNVMVEYNIPAAKTADEFSTSIKAMVGYLRKKFDDKGLKLAIAPSMIFTKSQLDHEQARRIGCEGDFCVWTRSLNPNPKDAPELETMRSAGGHVHVSFTVDGKLPDDILQVEEVVKGIDASLGVMSVILDKDTRRKKLYGKSGAFRPKPYGIEYRTLSNFWITKPEYTDWVFNTIQNVFAYLQSCHRDGRTPWWYGGYEDMIKECINSSDVKRATVLVELRHMKMPLVVAKVPDVAPMPDQA